MVTTRNYYFNQFTVASFKLLPLWSCSMLNLERGITGTMCCHARF